MLMRDSVMTLFPDDAVEIATEEMPRMSESLVLAHERDSVLTLTLNSPHKLNALTLEVFEELDGHLARARAGSDVTCVVLQGAGRAFCAGHDLKALDGDSDPATITFEAATIDSLESLPMPTVAKIHGYCLTGGLELALGCDLIVAAESTKIGDTHGRWGLAPVWGMSVRLPELYNRTGNHDRRSRLDFERSLPFGIPDNPPV